MVKNTVFLASFRRLLLAGLSLVALFSSFPSPSPCSSASHVPSSKLPAPVSTVFADTCRNSFRPPGSHVHGDDGVRKLNGVSCGVLGCRFEDLHFGFGESGHGHWTFEIGAPVLLRRRFWSFPSVFCFHVSRCFLNGAPRAVYTCV